MRTALLAADRGSSHGTLRAGLTLAGRTVLAWQAELARALGCEQVVVLGHAADETLAQAERECRAHGIGFRRLVAFSGLASLVHVEDELVLLADGLVPDQHTLIALFAPQGRGQPLRKMVLCLPADDPQAMRFPEIDAARCWAGVAVIRAAPAQRLGDFPPDSNAISLLLRMALQAGTPGHTLTPSPQVSAPGLIADAAESLSRAEQAMIAQQREPASWSAPTLAFTEALGARFALRTDDGAEAAANLGAAASLLTGMAAAVAGWVLAAMMASLLGSWLFDLAAAFGRIRRGVLGGKHAAVWARLNDPGRDGLVVLALSAALGPSALAALAPLAIGTARLAQRAARPLAAAFWRDRTAQIAVMTLGAGLGWLAQAAALFALAALAQALLARPVPSIPE